MANQMIRLGQNSVHWVNEEIIKLSKTVKELKGILETIPESEHEFLENLFDLFHKEDKPSKKDKGGE